ncbi:MAG: hypothetical protein CBD74_04495, partial [Saprospirales bacterium TMED214]
MAYESLPKQGNSTVTDSSVLVTQNFATQIDHSEDEANRFDPIKVEGNVSVSENAPFSTYGEFRGKMNAPAVDQHNYMYYGNGIGSADGITVVSASHMNITSGGTLYQSCGKIYAYDDSGNLLWEKENPQPSDYANFGVDIAVGGGRIVVSCHRDKNATTSYQGTAYVFDYNGNQLARLEADATDVSNDPDLNFGERVAIGNSYIAIGVDRTRASAYLDGSTNYLSNSLGVIYFYNKDTLEFVEKKFIPAAEWSGSGTVNFGSRIAFGDGKFIASAQSWTYESTWTTYTQTGGVFIYDENTLQFEVSCKLPADQIDESGKYLGNWGLQIAGGKIFVECRTDNQFQTNSGAVYVFDLQGNFIDKLKSPSPASSEYFGYAIAANSRFVAILSSHRNNYGGSSGEFYLFETTTLNHVLTVEKSEWGNNGTGGFSSTAFTFGSNGILYAGNGSANDLNTNLVAGHVVKWDMSGSLQAPPFEFSYIKSLKAEAGAGSGDSISNNHYFGKAMAIGGSKLFVSAPRGNYNANIGVYGSNIGAVYVFDLDGNYLNKLESSVPEGGMNFGSGMAAGDGVIAIASDQADFNGGGNAGGYWDSGRLDIFNLSDLSLVASVLPPATSNYVNLGKLDANGFYQQFSISQTVAVGHNLIVAGAPMEENSSGSNLYGAVYVWDTDGNYQFKISSPDGERNAFGASVAVGENRIIVGAPYGSSCKVYWFDLSGNHLFTCGAGTSGISESNVYSDQYGFAVRIYQGVLYISVPSGDKQSTDAGQIEKWSIANQSYLGVIQPYFYYSSYHYFGAAFDVGEGYLVAGLPGEDENTSNCGAIAGFYSDGGALTNQMYNPSVEAISSTEYNEYFGDGIVIGEGRILAGAWRRSNKTGDCYLYRTSGIPFKATLLDGNSYLRSAVDPANSIMVAQKTSYSEAPSAWYGRNVVANSSRVVVGAERINNYKGKVYIYDLDMNEITTLECPDEVSSDSQIYFGSSLAISDIHIAISAPNKHVNGNNRSGSVYLYDLDGNYIRTFLPLDDSGTNESRADSYFGRGTQGVALTNDLIVISSSYWPLNGSNNAGKVWLYNIDGTIIKSLVGDGTEDWVVEGGDRFGQKIAMNEGKILVTCPYGQLSSGYANASGFVAIFDYNGDYIGRVVDPETTGTMGFSNGAIEIKNGFIYIPAVGHSYSGTNNSGRYYIFDTDLNYIRYVTQFGPLIGGNNGFTGISVSSERLYLGSYHANDYGGVIFVYTIDGGAIYTISNNDGNEYLGWDKSFAAIGENLYAGGYNNETAGGAAGVVYKFGPGEAELNFETNDFSVEMLFDQTNNTQTTPQDTFHMLGSSDPADNGWSLKLNHAPQSTAPQHIVSVGSTQATADQYFGASVGVGTEVIVVGEPYAENNASPDNSGELHVYDTQGNILYNVNNLSGAEADENLGGSVKVRDGLIIASATGHQGNEGKVYILEESTTNQGVSTILKPTDLSSGDRFGSDVGAADELIVAGTRSTSSEGKAYVFNRSGTLQTTLEPTDAGAGSIDFDGSSDRFSVSNREDFEFGSGNFTIESWIYIDNQSEASGIVSKWYGSGTRSWNLHVYWDGALTLRLSTGNLYTSIATPAGTIALNTWYHVAAVRNGDDVTLYVDGVSSANATYTGALDSVAADAYIGWAQGYYMRGWISNLRIAKEAIYTGNFTPPTEQLNLTESTTVLLAAQSPTSMSLERTGKLLTMDGNPQPSSFNPGFPVVDQFGYSVDVGSNFIAVGSPRHNFGGGAVYIYDYNGQQKAKIVPSGVLDFGQSVRIVSDGVICGTSDAGIYKYNFSGGLVWTYNPTQLDGLGGQLDADDDYVISGQPSFNPGNNSYSGAATVLLSSDGSLVSQLQPQESATGQNYGIDTAFSNGRFVVGASRATLSTSYAGNAEIYSPTYDVARKATFAYNYENPDFEGAVYFDGVDDKLTFNPQGDEFALGDEEWTIEFWIKLVEDVPVTNYGLVIFSNLEWEDDPQESYYYSIKRGGIRFASYRDGSMNKIRAYIYTEDRTSYSIVTSSDYHPLEVGKWHHICYQHSDYILSNGEVRKRQNLYIDGNHTDYSTLGPGRMGKPDSEPVERFVIGAEEAGNPNGWTYFKGYISNFRFVRGKVVYNKDKLTQSSPGASIHYSIDENLIPPNKALQNVDDTILLACYHPTNFTKEITGTTVSYSGNPVATTDSPKLKAGALEFDGAGQSMNLSAGNIFEYGTNDFTIEFWINSSDNTVSGSESRTILSYDASDNQGDVYLEVGTGKVIFGNTTTPYLHTKSTSSVTDGYWHHVAICRSNGNVSIFIDGVKEVTTANTIDYQAPSGGTQYLTAFPDGPIGSDFNDIGDYAYTSVVKGGWRNAWNQGAVDNGYMEWQPADNRWKISRQYPDMTNTYWVYSAFNTSPGTAYTITFEGEGWGGRNVMLRYGYLNGELYSDGYPEWYDTFGNSQYYTEQSINPNVGGSPAVFEFIPQGSISFVAFKSSSSSGYIYVHQLSISKSVAAATVGSSSNGGGHFSGKLSNLHINKKTAKYAVDFTPPTRNIERSSGSSLIMANDSTDITTEKSGKEVIRNGSIYPGNFATSFKYNNSGQYTGYYDQFNLSSEHFQWEAWVNFTETAKYSSYFRSIFTANRSSSEGDSSNFHVYIADGSIAGQPEGAIIFRKGTILGVTSPLNDGDWHHIAATRGDGDNNNYKFYVDGLLVDEGNTSGTASGRTNPQLQWGLAYYSNSRFIGSIADSRLIKGGYIYSGDFTPPTSSLEMVTEVPSGQSSTTVQTLALLNSPTTVNNLATYFGDVSLTTYSTVTIDIDSPYAAGAPDVIKFNGGHLTMVDPAVKDFLNQGGKEKFYLEFWINPQSHKYGDIFKSPLISHSNPNGSNTRSTFSWDYRGNGTYNDPGGYGIYTTSLSGYLSGENTSTSGDATQVFGTSMSNFFGSYNGRGIYFNPIPIYKGQKVELYVNDNNNGNYGSRIWINQTINTNEYGGQNVWVDLTPTIDNEISDPLTPFNLHSLGWNAPTGSYSGSYRYIGALRIDGVEIYSNYPVGEFPEFIDETNKELSKAVKANEIKNKDEAQKRWTHKYELVPWPEL